jgi:hypothetical protein
MKSIYDYFEAFEASEEKIISDSASELKLLTSKLEAEEISPEEYQELSNDLLDVGKLEFLLEDVSSRIKIQKALETLGMLAEKALSRFI